MTDTHAHLYADEFNSDRHEMIQRATDNQVTTFYLPNIDHTSIDGMLELELAYPGVCIPMMGLHPCYVKKGFERELYIVEKWLSERKFSAIGEIGTDLYWDKSTWEMQCEVFRIQIDWAIKYQLPVAIHCRESIDETIQILTEINNPKLKGVFHCFTGSLEQARKILDLGFLLGIGGVSTFKKGGLDLVLPHLELESIVLETDSPYLAPVPHRGKRNEPAYLALIGARVAELMNKPLSQVADITTFNATNLFAY